MARPRSFDRDAALDHAMRAFWADGYERTSIADLTKAMNIAPPSLYAAFGDKERLFDEAVARYQAGLGSAVRAGLADGDDARAGVAAMLAAAARDYPRPGTPRGCFVLAEPRLAPQRERTRRALRARLAADPDPAVSEQATALTAFYLAVLAGMSARARDGASARELRSVADTAMTAWPGALVP